jgi:SAM-dependent methyltransferase
MLRQPPTAQAMSAKRNSGPAGGNSMHSNLPSTNWQGNGTAACAVGYSMRAFEDYFSGLAKTYAHYRPTYPEGLYSYLASIAPHHRLAWDCGTGNGQAALGLASHFDRVVATDASADQITLAPYHNRVEYRIARSESAGLDNHSAALVTVAVAVHWFDLEEFYAEVRRVSHPEGVIAVWCYSLPSIEPAIDRILDYYMREILSEFWPDRFQYVLDQYRNLPFPFKELNPPTFTMETVLDLRGVLGFLQSWSGTANYEKRKGESPIGLIRAELTKEWGRESVERKLYWNLYPRVGRVG